MKAQTVIKTIALILLLAAAWASSSVTAQGLNPAAYAAESESNSN